MLIELADIGLNTEAQKRLKVLYKGQIVKAHEIQLVNYLVSTNKPVGLVLDFAKDKVEIKRKVKDL